MQVRVLGALRLGGWAGGVEVPGGRSRVLFAMLVAARGRAVTADALMDAMWGDDPPADPANALQASVSRLRKLLAQAGDPEAIRTVEGGYRLERLEVDADRFEELSARARSLLETDPRAAAETAREALQLWAGPAFGEVAEHPAIRSDATRLEEERLATLDVRIDADLSAGSGPGLVAELRELVAQHPLHERFHGQLMVALYRAGRQTEALDVFHRLEATLREELGLDPSGELQDLQRAVLAQDPGLEPAEAAPARAGLPPALTSFVGRERETKEVTNLLNTSRLVTLLGPGGVGKTRLALEVARATADRYDDGVVLVELAAHTDPAAVLPHLAVAVGALPTLQADTAVDPVSLTDRLARRLRDRELLIVLDNCEHLLDAAAEAATAVLRVAARVAILATSREGLRVPGEVLWSVPPLVIDDALALFGDRARAVQSRFTLGERTSELVTGICRRLDGLPLAIELAAARTSALALEELAGRLDDRFRLLVGGSRTAARRQQTLEAVVEWSNDLLDDVQRAVFRRLGVFAGGFVLQAAEAVATADDVGVADVLPAVLDLVEKSLVVHDPDEGRYHLLETLREFALRRLAAEGDPDDTRGRHFAWYATFATAADAGIRGSDQLSWLERLEGEHDNLRAALAWALERDPSEALELGCRLAWFWWLHLHRAEGGRWLDAALAAELSPTGARAEALAQRSMLAFFEGTPAPELLPAIDEALTLIDAAAGGDLRVARVALLCSFVVLQVGDVRRGFALADRAAAAARAVGDRWIEATARFIRGGGALLGGDPDGSVVEMEAAIVSAREAGDRWLEFQSRQVIASVDMVRGRYEDADAHLVACLDLGEQLAIGDQVWAIRAERGMLAMLGGDLDRARARLRDVVEGCRHVVPVAAAWYGLGMVERRSGDLDAAALAYQEAADRFAAAEMEVGQAEALGGLVHVAAARGHVEQAGSLLSAAAALARPWPVPRTRAYLLEAGAAAALAAGDPELAARRLGCATELRASVGMPLVAGERSDVDPLEAELRQMMGDEVEAAQLRGAGEEPDDLLG